MKLKEQLLIELLLISFLGSTQGKSDTFERDNNHCRNDSDCSTWFTCDSNKECVCGNGHSGAVVCDNHRQMSAVLDCHCVTYDKESQSIFAGLCF